MSSDAAYSFGPFRLDPADRRLTRDGAPVEVSARYLDALILLVAESGRLVTKDRFMDEVWRGIPVTDEALTQCIRSLRRALGDDATAPRYIETVPRHGYRFGAPVQRAEADSAQPARRSRAWSGVVADGAAGAFGGALAGAVGALGYVSAGLVGPGIGAASTLLVLLSINLLLGAIAGGTIGAVIAFASARAGPSSGWIIAAAAAAGLLVGALGHMIGNDLFELLFGRSPGPITGGSEGILVGAATGIGLWIATRAANHGTPWRMVPAVVAGLAAGALIALAGGRLMVGSLAQLAARFPGSRLAGLIGENGAGDTALLAATAIESALFVGFTVGAIVTARRLRTASRH